MSQGTPRFRLPAAFVSPASIILIGGICYYFSLDFTPAEELEATLEKKFPQVRLRVTVAGVTVGTGDSRLRETLRCSL